MQSSLLIAGLTGGIATGKSTVSAFFRELGAHIIDADQYAKKAVTPKKPTWHKIMAAFGPSILQEDGAIDRSVLGEIVFNDATAKKKLEAIVHPVVRQMMLDKIGEIGQAPHSPLIVLDIPLLFESGWNEMVDKVIVVYIPDKLQRKRLMERDHLTESQALARIYSQMSITAKRVLADMVIDNSRSKDETKQQVSILYDAWTASQPIRFSERPRFSQ